MNGQFIPGSSETLNKQTHLRLLNEAASARRLRKSSASGNDAPPVKYAPHAPQPGLLEPLISAVLTAAFVIQVVFQIRI